MSKAEVVEDGAKGVKEFIEKMQRTGDHSHSLDPGSIKADKYGFNHTAERTLEGGKEHHYVREGVRGIGRLTGRKAMKYGGIYVGGKMLMGGLTSKNHAEGMGEGLANGVGDIFTVGVAALTQFLKIVSKPIIGMMKGVTNTINKSNSKTVITDHGLQSTKGMSSSQLADEHQTVGDMQNTAQKAGSDAKNMVQNQDRYQQSVNDYQNQKTGPDNQKDNQAEMQA